MTVLGAKSKSHKAVLECVTQLIYIYRSSPSAPIRNPSVSPSRPHSESSTAVSPTQLLHCHKIEQVAQVIDNKAVAVLTGQP
jgi:hypothetical protein